MNERLKNEYKSLSGQNVNPGHVTKLVNEIGASDKRLLDLKSDLSAANNSLGMLDTILTGGSIASALWSGLRGGATGAATGSRFGGVGALIGALLGVAAAAGIGSGLANTLMGIQNDLRTDIDEFKEDIEEELSDANTATRPILNRIMSNLIKFQTEASKIDTLPPNKEGGEKYEHFMSISQTLVNQMEADLELFYKAKGSLLPSMMQDLDIKNSWAAFKDSYDEEMSARAQVLLAYGVQLDKESMQAASPSELSDATDPSSGAATAPDSASPGAGKTRGNSSANIKEMQEFLERLPAEVTQVPPDLMLVPSGEMDQATRMALDHFARFVAKDLGVGNLSGTRLETEGTGPKLRQIWDLYQNPWSTNR